MRLVYRRRSSETLRKVSLTMVSLSRLLSALVRVPRSLETAKWKQEAVSRSLTSWPYCLIWFNCCSQLRKKKQKRFFLVNTFESAGITLRHDVWSMMHKEIEKWTGNFRTESDGRPNSLGRWSLWLQKTSGERGRTAYLNVKNSMLLINDEKTKYLHKI